MEDSFEARLQGQIPAPAAAPKKGNKAWMITAIVSLVLLVGVSIFAVIGWTRESDGDSAALTKKISERDSKIEKLESEKKLLESQIEGLSEETAEEEAKEEVKEEPVQTQTLELANYKTDIKAFRDKFIGDEQNMRPLKLEYTKDNKYLVLISDVSDGMSGYAGVWYKEAGEGKEWKELQSGHSFGECSSYTQEQRNFMKTYEYMDDDLNSRYVGCEEE